MRSKLVLMLAIVMGVVTTFLFYNYMKSFDTVSTVSNNTVDVVVAKEPIQQNEKITSGKVTLEAFPKNAVHEQAVTNKDDVIGLYATANLVEGEVILTERVQKQEDEQIVVSRKIKPGYRAVSVGVNFVQSVSNLIEPEDEVDVVASQEDGNDEMETTLILSKVKVLAVGRTLVESTSKEDDAEYKSVTLELKPDNAVTLINAAEKGNIQLILHSRLVPDKDGINDDN